MRNISPSHPSPILLRGSHYLFLTCPSRDALSGVLLLWWNQAITKRGSLDMEWGIGSTFVTPTCTHRHTHRHRHTHTHRGNLARTPGAGQWVLATGLRTQKLEMGKLVPPGFGFHFTPLLVLPWGLWVSFAVTQEAGGCSQMALPAAPALVASASLLLIYNHPVTRLTHWRRCQM